MEGTEEKFRTLHPEGKQGVNIRKDKYEVMRKTILSCLKAGDKTYSDLAVCVGGKIGGLFEGSVIWYVESVKLDLEARGTISRIREKQRTLLRINRA